MRLTKFGTFLLVLLVLAVIFGSMFFTESGIFAPKIEASQPITQNNGAPATVQPNAQPSSGDSNSPVAPVLPGLNPVAPVITNGYYPGQCAPDDTRTELVVPFDGYAGFFPVIVQYMTMRSDHYCLSLLPKFSGPPNYENNSFTESEIEDGVKSGEYDVYFASNGALSLWDSKSGLVVWTTDQSAGADAIVVRNSVASPNGPIDPVTGLRRPTFNDALGQTVCTPRGSADNYFIFTALQAAGFLQGDVNIRYTDYPVKDFNAGLCSFVVYWDPAIRDAMTSDTTTIITTKEWRTISDYIVVSPNADANKEDALMHFFADYNASTSAFTVENLPATANLLVTWVHDGNNMSDWMFLNPDKPLESLRDLTSKVAYSTLNNNILMFGSDFYGWNLVRDQLDKAHASMALYGVLDNSPENTKGSIYDSSIFVSSKYVDALNKSGQVSVTGDFDNKYITDVNEDRPDVEDSVLFTLPEILSLQHKNIGFVEGQSRELLDGEYETLVTLMQQMAYQMTLSPDMVIVIQGGHGLYSTNETVMRTQARLAFRRASYIAEILSDPKGLNIPLNRIVINPTPIAPDHPLTDAELPNYIVVLIKMVNSGGVK